MHAIYLYSRDRAINRALQARIEDLILSQNVYPIDLSTEAGLGQLCNCIRDYPLVKVIAYFDALDGRSQAEETNKFVYSCVSKLANNNFSGTLVLASQADLSADENIAPVLSKLSGQVISYRVGTVIGAVDENESNLGGIIRLGHALEGVPSILRAALVELVSTLIGQDIYLTSHERLVSFLEHQCRHLHEAKSNRSGYLYERESLSLRRLLGSEKESHELLAMTVSALAPMLMQSIPPLMSNSDVVETVKRVLAEKCGLDLAFLSRLISRPVKDGDIYPVECCEELARREWLDAIHRIHDRTFVNSSILATAFNGKTAAITGASSGLGKELAIQLSRLGANTILVARRRENLYAIKNEIEKIYGTTCAVYVCDLTDEQSIATTQAAICKEQGSIDYLFNNAGRSIRKPLSEDRDYAADMRKMMEINYIGAAGFLMGLLDKLLDDGGCTIVNSLSFVAKVSVPRFSAYAASKSALESFCDTLQAEYMDKGLGVVDVYLPLVRTPMISETHDYNSEKPYIFTAPRAASETLLAVAKRKRKYDFGFGAVLDLLPHSTKSLSLNLAYRITDPDYTDGYNTERSFVNKLVSGPVF